MRRQIVDQPGVRRRTSSQAGIAVVWALAWMYVCLTLSGVALVLSYAEARQHQVDGSADLAAIAAAAALQRGDDACRAASATAGANHVTLSSCRVEGLDVVVGVQARVNLPFGLHPWAHADSRAGPAS